MVASAPTGTRATAPPANGPKPKGSWLVKPCAIAAPYLAWVEFSDTGQLREDVAARAGQRACIFASPGLQCGPGGETWLRFNPATPRPILEQALARLADAIAAVRAGKRAS